MHSALFVKFWQLILISFVRPSEKLLRYPLMAAPKGSIERGDRSHADPLYVRMHV
jgi:hypothetical protein